MEIVTPEWRHQDNAEGNFVYILAVKEQRRLGTSRGKTVIPQAPVLTVRIKADTTGLTENAAVRAELWNYGVATKGKHAQRIEPAAVTKGEKLSKLRKDTYIACTYNIERFSEPREDGYRYADLGCFITRGARVISRKFHIALKLTAVVPKGDVRINTNEPQSRNVGGKWMSKTQASKLVKPDHEKDLIERTLTEIQPIRTARISVSEKAMCPRECDQVRKVVNRLAKNNYLSPGVKASLTNGLLSRKRKLSMDGLPESVYMKPAVNLMEAPKLISSMHQPVSPTLTPTPCPNPALLAKQISVYPLNGHSTYLFSNQNPLAKFQHHTPLEHYDRNNQLIIPSFPYVRLNPSYHPQRFLNNFAEKSASSEISNHNI